MRLDAPRAHVPPALAGEALARYRRAIEDAWRAYDGLATALRPVAQRLLVDRWQLAARPRRSREATVAREAEKRAIETARYVIPIACHTAMVYTVSGIVLHRMRRMAASCDVPDEARAVVERMVAAVERIDPDFFQTVGDAPLPVDETPEATLAPPGLGDPAFAAAFDRSLGGRRALLFDSSPRAPRTVADAVRSVLGRLDLSDDEAIDLVLDPARNRYRLETMNVSTHAPLMRALDHVHYSFRKKLSHSADSQDQRHRMVPGARPLLSRTAPPEPDVVEPELIRDDPVCHRMFGDAVGAAWEARAQLLRLGESPASGLYLLPNAVAVRFQESGSLLHLLHKWTMRSCWNAQREIYDATLEEIEQVRAVHPALARHIGPPCFVRDGRVRPRCPEGDRFCGVPVWRSFPNPPERTL